MKLNAGRRMNARLLLGGIKSYFPIRPAKYLGTGGTGSGAYCYSVWLRHLSFIAKYLGNPLHPSTVLELGPGDSIGLGIAALISGAERYIGLDVLPHMNVAANIHAFHEIVELFRRKADIPNEDSFPNLYPRLPSYGFPNHLFHKDVSDLPNDRLAQLLRAVSLTDEFQSPIRFIAPWSMDSVAPATADLIITHGTLQDMDHTQSRDDLTDNIKTMTRWLKPGGIMSHNIDLSCPGGTEWNHHWAYGDLAWSIIRGKRPYYKNRVPLSEYIKLFEAVNCRCIGIERLIRNGLPRKATAPRFHGLTEDDFCTAGALIVLKKT